MFLAESSAREVETLTELGPETIGDTVERSSVSFLAYLASESAEIMLFSILETVSELTLG